MTESPAHRRRRPSRLLVAVLVSLSVVIVAVLIVFQPQKLFYDKTVVEALPSGAPAAVDATLVVPTRPAPAPAPVPVPSHPAALSSALPTPAPRVSPTVLATGVFSSREHHTTGSASLLRLAGGDRVLRLEQLDTSNGPDLHVYLSMATTTASDRALARNAVNLGTLKGNKGSQNYAVPTGLDLRDVRSVVIWCKRFSVSFGVAPLQA